MRILISGLLAAALLIGGSSLGAGAAPSNAVLIVGVGNPDLLTLDPNRHFEYWSPEVIGAAYDTLVTVGDRGKDLTKIEPFLAESYTVSPDAKVYTFKLRRGVKFASGNPMTADDVVFSFKRLGNLQDNPAFLFNDNVSSIQAADPYTVSVTLKEPNVAFLPMMVSTNFAVLDARTLRDHKGTDAADAAKTDGARDWLNQNSAGTGPYVLTGWKRDVEVTLERNPNYWRRPPAFGRVVIRNIPDASTQLQEVQRGDIGIAQTLDVDLIERFKQSGKGYVAGGDSLTVIYLLMTNNPETSPWLARKDVRRAIAYAIDYKGITQGLMRGQAVRPPSIIPLGLVGVDPAMAVQEDLQRSKGLLQQAGVTGGFTAELLYPTFSLGGAISAETLSLKLQNDLRRVGINVTLRPVEPAAWRTQRRAAKFQMSYGSWNPDFADSDDYATGIGVAPVPRYIGYHNPQLAPLAAAARKTTDVRLRARIYREFQRILLEDAPYVSLLQPKVGYAVRSDVGGVSFNAITNLDFSTIAPR